MQIQLEKINPLRFFSAKSAVRPSRRRTQRVKSCSLLKYVPSIEGSQEMLTNVTNLSEAGLRFSSASELKTGSVLNMQINFPETEKQVPATGQVVWQKQIRGYQDAYRIGVAFLGLAAEDLKLIRGFVQKTSLLN